VAEPEPLRIPRVARLMALAIKFQGMVDRGEVRDYADLAQLGYVTRARLTQIMNLTLLAPDIQERLLFEADESSESCSFVERDIRRVSSVICWSNQRARYNTARRKDLRGAYSRANPPTR